MTMTKPAAVSCMHAVFLFSFQAFYFPKRFFFSREAIALIMISARLIHARHFLRRSSSCFVVHRRRQQQRICLSSSSSSSSASLNVLELAIPTPEDMEDVGAVLSMGTGPGDVILLGGDLGAGKTCFSRGFVRSRTGDLDLRVTSPTYLLSNTYDAGDCLIHHMDLYRLSGDEKDLAPLDMENVMNSCIALIEWPSRLGNTTPATRLDIFFRIQDDFTTDSGAQEKDDDDDDECIMRFLTLEAHGEQWSQRLQRLVDEGYVDDLLVTSS